MPYHIRFYCERRPWEMGTIAVYMRSVKPGINQIEPEPMVGLPMTFRTIKPEEDGCVIEPAMVMKGGDAQMLMDELWKCGLRPTEGTGSAGSLAATERHLADLRHLVFKTQPKDIP